MLPVWFLYAFIEKYWGVFVFKADLLCGWYNSFIVYIYLLQIYEL